MDPLISLIEENNLLWTEEYEKKVLKILTEWETGVKRSRQEYHLHQKFVIVNLAGISKVSVKKDSRLMATKKNVLSIIKDIHVSIGHKGEKKTYKKICENYANITRKIVSEFIKQCERCAEKSKGKLYNPEMQMF